MYVCIYGNTANPCVTQVAVNAIIQKLPLLFIRLTIPIDVKGFKG